MFYLPLVCRKSQHYFILLVQFSAVTDNVNLLSAMYDRNPSTIPNNNLNMPAANRQPAGIRIRQIYTNETFSSNFANTVRVSCMNENISNSLNS